MSMETFASICMALDAGADELLWGVANPSDAVLDMWNLSDKDKNRKSVRKTDGKISKDTDDRKTDSYAMYVKIMRSVAEIMNED